MVKLMIDFNKVHHFLSKRLFIVAGLSLFAFIVSQTLGRYVWQLELFSHFVPYYSGALLLSALLFPIASRGKRAKVMRGVRSVFVLVGLVLLMWCLPAYQQLKQYYELPSSVNESSLKQNSEQTLLIAYQNVNISNQNKQKTLSELNKNNPDVLILLEAGGNWLPHLASHKQLYPTHCGDDQFNPFAMQVFIAQSLASCEVITIEDLPMVSVQLETGSVIYVIHPPPPINSELAHKRLEYLHRVQALVKKETRPMMVIGDMNATAFSPVYRDFVQDTKLTATTANGLPTWQILKLPLFQESTLNQMLTLGIDHVLVTAHRFDSNIVVTPKAWHGSDHRGFEVSW